MSIKKKATKYFSASCNLNFTSESQADARDELLKYLKDLVKNKDVSSWFINEE